MKSAIVFIILVFALFAGNRAFSQSISAQDMEKFQIMEDSMLVTVDSMYEAFIPDTHIFYSERFAKQLVRTLKMPASYYYPFDKLKDKINIIYSDDTVSGYLTGRYCCQKLQNATMAPYNCRGKIKALRACWITQKKWVRGQKIAYLRAGNGLVRYITASCRTISRDVRSIRFSA